MGCCVRNCPVGPEDSVQFVAPPLYLEVESFLEVVHYGFICGFRMPVAFWISGACGLNLDFPLFAEIIEYLRDELRSIVGYYLVQ